MYDLVEIIFIIQVIGRFHSHIVHILSSRHIKILTKKSVTDYRFTTTN
jgi:hypothetical protein